MPLRLGVNTCKQWLEACCAPDVGESWMSDDLASAIENARLRLGGADWTKLSPREQSTEIYHELCRMDSGCRRTGEASDMLLPPCPASSSFVARRGCRVAGLRAQGAGEPND